MKGEATKLGRGQEKQQIGRILVLSKTDREKLEEVESRAVPKTHERMVDFEDDSRLEFGGVWVWSEYSLASDAQYTRISTHGSVPKATRLKTPSLVPG
jgi:hypothetical protein